MCYLAFNAEDAATLPAAPDEDDPRHYGANKAACEHVVLARPGGIVVRPGLIGGPHDPTGRFTYWPVRLAAGGDVLAPGPADVPVQVIDARDLAAWLLWPRGSRGSIPGASSRCGSATTRATPG